MEGGDGGAVVCHGNALVGADAAAVSHFLFRQHTAAAMDNEPVVRNAVGEGGSGGEFKCGLCPCKLAYPLRQLHASYIPALAVVCAALGYEDPVAALDLCESRRAAYRRVKVSLVACEKDREGREKNVLGNDL